MERNSTCFFGPLRFWHWPILLAGVFLPAYLLKANLPTVPEYKIGDVAAEDIVAPVPLVVVDLERTEALRQKEAQRVPAIYLFFPEVREEVEAKLRQTFYETREEFVEGLAAAYNGRKIARPALSQPKFRRFWNSFQRRHRSFPLTTNLVEIWALGDSDELILAEYVALVRGTMRNYIRQSALSPAARIGSGRVRMIPHPPGKPGPALEDVERSSIAVVRSNISTLHKSRQELQKTFSTEDQPVARFLASFLRPNCAFAEELTAQARARRTEELWAADHYQPGEIMIRKGEMIDARKRAALDELKARTAADRVRAEAARQQLKSRATVSSFREQASVAQLEAEMARRRTYWLLGGLGSAVFICFLLVWRTRTHSSAARLLPAPSTRALPQGVSVSPASTPPLLESAHPDSDPEVLPAAAESEEAIAAQAWKERALEAEQRAARATTILQNGLLRHLAIWFRQTLWRGLFSQRTQLLEAQKEAELEVAGIEQRLAEVQAPLEARLKAYEERIGELERDLAQKGEENRELIKAKIALTRKQLELERAKSDLAWN